MARHREPASFIPLTPTRYYILSSLFASPKHGYAIIKDIEAATDDKVSLGVPTLYENIKRLLDDGLIEPGGDVTVQGGETRKAYRLSGLGQSVLALDEGARRPVMLRNRRMLRGEA
ncbi:MAG TPA: PadR family transcriptional regulator [Dehalococcoidia bacterium]|jgi:DNA-binding PadR family transcriptional regulator|nr:PadR family transcriptional regulator [Dehalococcoidia bacterium]